MEAGRVWGDQGPQFRVNVVDGQGMVIVGVVRVGVWRRHLLDARGHAPHRLDLRLRGLPASLPRPLAPTLPSLPRALSSLSAVAHVAPPVLAPGPFPCPRALSLPPAPGSCAPPPACCLARFPYRAPCLPHRRPCPCLSRPCALPRYRLRLCPSCAPAPLRRCERPGPSPASAPPAPARAFARPWYLPPSSTTCHLSTAAFCPLPWASAFCIPPRTIAVSSVSPGPLASCLDHPTLQLRQRDDHRHAFGGWDADGPWPPLREDGLGRVQLAGANVAVARLGVCGVLGARRALRCGLCGPWRLAWWGALGKRGAGPARRWRTVGCGVASWCGCCGTMRPVRRRVRGPSCGQGGRGNSMGGRGSLPGQLRFGDRRLGVAWGRAGLLSQQADRNRGLPQPPLLPRILGRRGSGSETSGGGSRPAGGSHPSLTL